MHGTRLFAWMLAAALALAAPALALDLDEARSKGLVGERAWNHLFEGHIDGGRISGRLRVSDGNQTRSYPWMATRLP